ncbi:SDR family oxidoreductase [uncultured Streptococcus sp.]|uniref:SDR family oxidoreductase n=1 Tax=uncultured Streptococcus sp. TaxID=83427 RepID=UPI0027DD6095|nr:SDR family oxidoreductase [uncultured Streptococcus sp.]
MTPLELDELSGPRGDGYRAMIAKTVEKRAATPDEIGDLAAFMMGPSGHFINGSDFLIDGGVTANYWYGDIKEVRTYEK